MADPTQPTPEKAWKPVFLRDLGEHANVSKAARKARIHRSTAYEERDNDPEFATAWAKAIVLGTEALEDEIRRRAHEGTLKPIYQGGKRVGSVREFSDTLAIFLLKAHKPELYRESSRSLNITITAEELRQLDDNDLDELERKLAGAR